MLVSCKTLLIVFPANRRVFRACVAVLMCLLLLCSRAAHHCFCGSKIMEVSHPLAISSLVVLLAVKGLDLYKESIASNEALATYYATIEQIEEVGGM